MTHALKLHWISLWTVVLATIANAAVAVAAPKTAPVNVQTTPAGAEVTLLEPAPERLLGTTPLVKVKLPQGPAKIRLRMQGYEDKVEVVTIGAKETTFTFALVRKILPATLDIAGDAASQGAEITVDGEVKGRLPLKVQVPPGKHQIVVRKPGYIAWEKWTDVGENQLTTFDIALKSQEKPKGSLLVSSAPPAADVRVNGAPRGKAPQLVENLEPGSYEVDLTLDGFKPFRQTVTVREGQRETVSGVLESLAVPTGELTVLCDAAQAALFVDGEAKGVSPAKVTGLKAGEHIVECRAPGYPPTQQTVTVRAGEVKTVQLSPRQAVAAQRGAISVSANVPTAKVKVGDSELRKVPAQFDDLPPNKYLVTVQADGYTAESVTVAVEPQKTAEVKVDLKAIGKIVVSIPQGRRANVYVDGEIKGAAPLSLDVAVGPHKVKIAEEGVPNPASEMFDVPVLAGQTARVDAQLIPPPPPRLVRRSNPTSAHVNEVGKGTVQLGLGLPVPGQITVMAGVAPDVAAGLDIQIAGMINEFVLTGAYRVVGNNAFAFGVQGGLGGGLGPSDRNSFTMHIKPVASLLLGDSSSFSLYAQARFFTDKFGGTNAKRQSDFVLPVGMQAEFQINPNFNLFGKFEMDFVNPGARKIYNEPFDKVNSKASGAIGVTWLLN